MKNIPQLKISRNNSAFSTEASASQVQTKRNSDKGPHESMRISMLPVAAAVATALFAFRKVTRKPWVAKIYVLEYSGIFLSRVWFVMDDFCVPKQKSEVSRCSVGVI